MTKRDYEAAARICQDIEHDPARAIAREAFAELFTCDNPEFDAVRFRAACIPGQNVRARRHA